MARSNDAVRSDLARGDLSREPMTPAQASCLRLLAEKAFELEAFDRRLSRSEAARRIEALRAKLRLQDGPPHTL
jgi:hypothetical protein